MQAREAGLKERVPAHSYVEEAIRPSPTVASRVKASKALFLLAAAASFLLSVSLWFLADKEQGLFVGLWVPSILSLGAFLHAGRGGEQ
jgi:hypothetical protein